MKNSNIGTFEITGNIQVEVVSDSGLASGDDKFSLRVALPELSNVSCQQSDVYIGVKHPIPFPGQKTFKLRTWKVLEVTTTSVSKHGQSHCERCKAGTFRSKYEYR